MGALAIIGAFIGNANVVGLLIFIVVLLLSYHCLRKPRGIPPGPRYTLPFIGDLPHLIRGDVIGTFRKLRQKHGDIFSFYMGKELTIVLNGYNVIHEAAVVNGNVFSGRPTFLAIKESGGKKGIVWTDGLLWKNQRRFSHRHLQQFEFGRASFETNILREVDRFIKALKAEVGRPTFMNYINASVANVVFSIVCGKAHDYDDKQFQHILHDIEIDASQALKQRILLSSFPFLKYIPGDPLNMKQIHQRHLTRMEYFRNMYDEHVRNLDEKDPKDFFDVFILEMFNGDHPDFTVEQLSTIARDLLAASEETTATTIRWAVLCLVKYKSIKARLHADIDGMIPSNRAPRLEDKAKLPYVEAFIMEVQRFAEIVPLAVPHAVTNDDVVFHGYKFPKNKQILFNLDSVLKDPDIFENPEQFNPERFLDADGMVFRPKEFIPFGIGRRICLGRAVAKMELFLYLTTMIKGPEGQSEPDMEGALGVTYAPKPFKVRAIPRQ